MTNEIQKNSNELQRNRLLKRLQQGACTTVELRHQEDILGVAPRVFELRHKYGHNIQTHWSEDFNPGSSTPHKVAKYVLMAGKWQNDKGDFYE